VTGSLGSVQNCTVLARVHDRGDGEAKMLTVVSRESYGGQAEMTALP
jgi:hypothetical protein